MSQDSGELLLAEIQRVFTAQKTAGDRALAQLTDEDFFRTLDDESNSVAIIMKHVGGNLRSRWTDFLTSDGEKPDRHRDAEFEPDAKTRAQVTAIWDGGFAVLFDTLSTLRSADLVASVQIRGESLGVVQALFRSLAHTSQHVGQIIMLAKHWRGSAWQTLSIPRARTQK